jgi:threonine dehydrogenase-like Zn-dependent dehydrogenase
MRALVYIAPHKVEMQDVARPQPLEGESEIAVMAAGICGSDISGFLGHSRRRIPPLVLGHELVGRRRDGKRVVVNPLISCGRCMACLSGAQNLCSSWRLLGMDRTAGCYAEFVSVPDSQVYEVPDELSDARAVMAEPLANIVHLFRIAAPLPFFRMGIVGGGTMGSLALLVAKRLGVRDVLVQDVSEVRLDTARRMGATLAVNVSAEEGRAEARRFAGHGLDLVLDASGTGPARQAAFDLCRPGGLVVLLGMSNERSAIDFVTSIRKEHSVVMSFAYSPVDFERSLALLKAGEIDITPWTVEMPLEQGQKAFDRMSSAPGDTLKMVFRVSSRLL